MRATTAILLLALISPAAAGEVSGPARVIDGDTVDVGGVRVRLKGVDAAELNTSLGRNAKLAMIAIVKNQPLACSLTGEKTYKREVGYCFLPDGTDIGQAIIEQGYALSCPRYDTRYVEYETQGARDWQLRAKYCGTPHPQSPATQITAPTGQADYETQFARIDATRQAAEKKAETVRINAEFAAAEKKAYEDRKEHEAFVDALPAFFFLIFSIVAMLGIAIWFLLLLLRIPGGGVVLMMLSMLFGRGGRRRW